MRFDEIVQCCNTDRVLFGIPKKGRLHEKVLKILNGAGLDFKRLPRLDLAECTKLPVTLVFLPAHDIADYVGGGRLHMGITGEDMIKESGLHDDIKVLSKLGFGNCRLCVQAPVGKYKDAKDLCGKRIVTSFSRVAGEFFSTLDPKKETIIKNVNGSVEVACALGLADAVVDLVETGTTMRAAGLEIVETIMTTQCVLISKAKTSEQTETLIDRIHKRIEGYLISMKYSMVTYNLPKAALQRAKEITPGKQAPTVSVLEDPTWISVSSLVKSSEISEIMDDLVSIGARSILNFQINNCRFPGEHTDPCTSPPSMKKRKPEVSPAPMKKQKAK